MHESQSKQYRICRNRALSIYCASWQDIYSLRRLQATALVYIFFNMANKNCLMGILSETRTESFLELESSSPKMTLVSSSRLKKVYAAIT